LTIDAPDLSARRHTLHAAGTRSTLLTVLSIFVFRRPDPVPTTVLIDALGKLQFEPHAVRMALNRTASRGLIRSSKVGRRALWELTQEGHDLMVEGETRLMELRAHSRGWDGKLVIVSATVPSNDRQLGHLLRTRLSWLGFGPMSPTTWVGLRTTAEAQTAHVLKQLNVQANSFVAEPGQIGDLRDVINRAWDLEALAASYTAFADEFEPLRESREESALIALVRMTHAWRKFPFSDPGLPVSLLPVDWPGLRASLVHDALIQQLRAPAQAEWDQLLATSTNGD
jgi:phenylacetic acid degradation operon negative regulatory protein